MKSNRKTTRKESDSGTLVRINRRDKEVLQQIAAEEGEAMPAILHKAIEVYRRQKFLEQVNVSYDHLRKNEDSWQLEVEERQLWEIARGGGAGQSGAAGSDSLDQ